MGLSSNNVAVTVDGVERVRQKSNRAESSEVSTESTAQVKKTLHPVVLLHGHEAEVCIFLEIRFHVSVIVGICFSVEPCLFGFVSHGVRTAFFLPPLPSQHIVNSGLKTHRLEYGPGKMYSRKLRKVQILRKPLSRNSRFHTQNQ